MPIIRDQQIDLILRRRVIRINPYKFMGGVDCLSSIMNLSKMLGGYFVAGSAGGPIAIIDIENLSIEDIGIAVDLIQEHYPKDMPLAY